MSDPVSRLNITTSSDELVVSGELDAHTCGGLVDALEPLPGEGDIRLEVSGVGFMDSSGLRALIGAHQSAEAAGRKLLIVRPTKAVARIIEISGLDDHLNVVGDD
ncbi:MAG: STAS domain-containing protein [Ilumatobacter sp.]